MIRKAINFTVTKHFNQIRNGSGLPYYVHPINVFSIIRKFKESKQIENLLCAALLHDILEDTDVTFEEILIEFNSIIATICLELKNDVQEIRSIGKYNYMCKKLIGLSSYALTIKLADILDNISDEPTIKQRKIYIDIIKYIKEYRILSETQKKLCSEIFKFEKL